MQGSSYRPRVLCVRHERDLIEELKLIHVDPHDAARAFSALNRVVLKLRGVPAPLARLLDTTLTSAGGHVVLSREFVKGETDTADAVLIGSENHFGCAVQALRSGEHGAPQLASEIENALTAYEQGPFLPDESEEPHPKARWILRELRKRTLVMGILNVTPDSFSEGGRFLDRKAAVGHGLEMVEQGADIIDVGGESTRPGSAPVPVEEEIARVAPVIEELVVHTDVPVSIDTYHARTAAAAIAAGASIVNDISGMAFDPEMREVAAEHSCPVILMHIKGAPRDMQKNPVYRDLMGEIADYLRERIIDAVQAGVSEKLIIIDPGIGFGKTVQHNLEVLRSLSELRTLGRPILVGVSRKSTIGHVLGGLPPEERLEGTAAAVALSIANGANIVRVHDVKEMARVAKMADAIVRSQGHELR